MPNTSQQPTNNPKNTESKADLHARIQQLDSIKQSRQETYDVFAADKDAFSNKDLKDWEVSANAAIQGGIPLKPNEFEQKTADLRLEPLEYYIKEFLAKGLSQDEARKRAGTKRILIMQKMEEQKALHTEALKEVPESRINISAGDLTKLLMKTLPVELVPNKEKMEELTAKPATITDNLTNYLLNTPAVKKMGDKGPAFVDSTVGEIAEKLAA